MTAFRLDEAFRVYQGKISLARQPEFAPACQALMSAAMGSAVKWLDSRQDLRRSRLVPNGRVRMDVETVGEWISVLNQWRRSRAWAPDVKQVRACAG